jgi:flagellar biogenesis protein FliO
VAYALELFKFLVVIGLFAAGGYFMVKKIRKKQLTQTSMNGVITISDAVQFGMNDRLYLLKIGDEHIVYAMSNNGVSLLRLQQSEIEIPKEKFDELFSAGNPGNALKNVTKVLGDKFKQ